LNITDEWDEFLDIYEHPDGDQSDSDPEARLSLDGEFRDELHREALALNEDFLVNA
jgi:hypothetical protein